MLKINCINPLIMKYISQCGHGDRILIADGNYPLDSKTVTDNKVYLGLTAGIPTVPQVIETLQELVNIEKAELMQPDEEVEPAIFSVFADMLGNIPFKQLGRYDFYDTCLENDIKLAISTGEKRIFANIILTVGVA